MMMTRSPQSRFLRRAPGPAGLAVMLAGVAAALLFSSPALGQHRPDVIRTPDRDIYRPGDGAPPVDIVRPIDGGASLDTLLNPMQPNQGDRDRVPDYLLKEFIDAFTRSDMVRALRLAREIVDAAPDRPIAHYNLACVLARTEEIPEALESFDRAIICGWRDVFHIAGDSDLDPMRDTGGFAMSMARLEHLIEEERIVPGLLRTDDPEVILEDLEAKLPALLERYHVPGVSVALVRDGKIAFVQGYGAADVRTSDAIGARTRFRLTGISPLLTAIAALRLDERGVWSLDDPLTKWLSVVSMDGPDTAGRMTIRRALNQTGGLRSRYAQVPLHAGVDEEIRKRMVFNPKLPVDVAWSCPEAYLAVGRAVELAYGSPLDGGEMPTFFQLCRNSLFLPLKMAETSFNRPTRSFGGFVSGHTEFGTPYRRVSTAPSPASPLYTTAGDMATLIEFMLGQYREADRSPLNTTSIEQIYQIAGADDEGFGLGVQVRKTQVGRAAELRGLTNGVGSLMRWYPEANCGVVVLFNSDTGMDAADRIASLVLGGI